MDHREDEMRVIRGVELVAGVVRTPSAESCATPRRPRRRTRSYPRCRTRRRGRCRPATMSRRWANTMAPSVAASATSARARERASPRGVVVRCGLSRRGPPARRATVRRAPSATARYGNAGTMFRRPSVLMRSGVAARAGAERDDDAAEGIEVAREASGDRDARSECEDEPGQQEEHQLH